MCVMVGLLVNMVCVYVCVHVCACVCFLCVCMAVRICVHVCSYVCMYVCACMHTCMQRPEGNAECLPQSLSPYFLRPDLVKRRPHQLVRLAGSRLQWPTLSLLPNSGIQMSTVASDFISVGVRDLNSSVHTPYWLSYTHSPAMSTYKTLIIYITGMFFY